MAKYTEARRRANEKYNAKAYDELKIRVPKGMKDELKAYAEAQGETVNGLVNRLIVQELSASEADPS